MANIGDNHPLMQAAYALSALEPATAWDVDADLSGFIQGTTALAEAFNDYIEGLDEIGVDPNVTEILRRSVESYNAAVVEQRRGLRLFLSIYQALMQTGETGLKVPTKPGFFDPKSQ